MSELLKRGANPMLLPMYLRLVPTTDPFLTEADRRGRYDVEYRKEPNGPVILLHRATNKPPTRRNKVVRYNCWPWRAVWQGVRADQGESR